MRRFIDDDPQVLRTTTACTRVGALGKFLDPVWSLHGPAPPPKIQQAPHSACFDRAVTGHWSTRFVLSYDWYLKAPEERARIMAEHGRNGFAQYPDVRARPCRRFGLLDYGGCSRSRPTAWTPPRGRHARNYTEGAT